VHRLRCRRGSTCVRNLPFARYKTSDCAKCHLACLSSDAKVSKCASIIVQLRGLMAFLSSLERFFLKFIARDRLACGSLNRETKQKAFPFVVDFLHSRDPRSRFALARESRKCTRRMHSPIFGEWQVTFSRVARRSSAMMIHVITIAEERNMIAARSFYAVGLRKWFEDLGGLIDKVIHRLDPSNTPSRKIF